ncbi:MAG: hypothetical protein H6825_03295 [Planctomycetes bacterium]|nr:hypothetical protein [Planctomycetota bacterium]
MFARTSLLPALAGLLLAPAALATNPVASGSLTCESDGTLSWSASASDVDGDLIGLSAGIRCYATQADCIADTNVLKIVQVADLSDAGTGSLAASGSLGAVEGRWYALLVDAADAAAGADSDMPPCCQATAPADERVVIGEGDVLAGVGTVTSIDNLVVDDDGNTIVELDTDNADTTADGALVLNGDLYIREGQALDAPAGAQVGSFDTVSLNTSLHSGWNFFLDNTGSTSTDSGLFWGTKLLIQEGSIAGATQFTPGTPYIGFFECKINEPGRIVALCSVDDPNIASSVDQAFVSLQVDTSGNLVAENVLYKEGDTLAGQVETIENFDTGPHAFALNANNELIYVANMTGDTTADYVVYIGDSLVAREGSPSPVAGRNWSSLSGAEVDLDDLGGWVVSGSLDGDSASNLLIATDAGKIAQEGDSLPGMNGFKITSFGSGPVKLGNSGNVLFFADWDDPDTTRDTGLFLNGQLIVQEGVTTVNGVVIDDLRGIQDGYTMSPDGDWLLFEANLVGGTEMAVLDHIGPWTFLGHGLAGTGGAQPMLRGRGTVQGGSLTRLELTNALPNTTTALVIGVSELSAPFKGGVMVPHPDVVLLGLPVDASGELTISFPFPTGTPAGVPVWFQEWPSDPGAVYGFSASNAVKATTP